MTMSHRSEPELPWWWCEVCEADCAVCVCDEGRPLGLEAGWDESMLHVVWTGRRLPRPVSDVETGGLL